MNTFSRAPRIYADVPLEGGRDVPLEKEQRHYLTRVMRLKAGDRARVFNSRDGEWLCELAGAGKRDFRLLCLEKLAEPSAPPDIDYIFAPLKHARVDYMAQKAAEMGARRLIPVFTEFTQVKRVNVGRLRANAIEAAEQCNLVFAPPVLEPVSFQALLDGWDASRAIIYCDEAAPLSNPLEALRAVPEGPLAVLIGPEGGFSPRERRRLRELDFVFPISLGPRIMRADTAAVAALALIQAVLGDWS